MRAAGFKLLNSRVDQFTLASRGDNALLEGNVFDGKNVHEQNFNLGRRRSSIDGPTGWVIRNNRFTNYTSPSTTHSEGDLRRWLRLERADRGQHVLPERQHRSHLLLLVRPERLRRHRRNPA